MLGHLLGLVLAWAAYEATRRTYPWLRVGRGWYWVALIGTLALAQWAVNLWVGNPLITPIVASLLYLFSLVGLAPDAAEGHHALVESSCWFRRGLVGATAGTGVGVGIWAWSM